MQANQFKQVMCFGLIFLSLCACQHTLTGIGMDMENTGKNIATYGKKA